MGHEEAIRTHSCCRHLQKLDILSDILQASLKRSLTKFDQNDKEDEFTDYMLAPDIICKSEIDTVVSFRMFQINVITQTTYGVKPWLH